MEESLLWLDLILTKGFGAALFIQFSSNVCNTMMIWKAVFLLLVMMTTRVYNGSFPSNE